MFPGRKIGPGRSTFFNLHVAARLRSVLAMRQDDKVTAGSKMLLHSLRRLCSTLGQRGSGALWGEGLSIVLGA